MLKLTFYSSLVLTIYLGTALDVKSAEPTRADIEIIRKKVLRPPTLGQPKENIPPQVKTRPSLKIGTSGFTRAGQSFQQIKEEAYDELVMVEIEPDSPSPASSSSQVDLTKSKESGASDLKRVGCLEPITGATNPLQLQEERLDIPAQMNPQTSLEAAPSDAYHLIPEKDPGSKSPDVSLQSPGAHQLPEDRSPSQGLSSLVVFQGPSPTVPQAESQEASEEELQEESQLISPAVTPVLSLPTSLMAVPALAVLPVLSQGAVAESKHYKELDLEPLVFKMRQEPCILPDASGSLSFPISFHSFSLREAFLHPSGRSWNFTGGLKFRFVTLSYDSYSGNFPAKQPERGNLRNRVGAELENWQVKFLKECAPYKEARRFLNEKEERVKRKQAAVTNFQNPEGRSEAYQKAQADLVGAKQDLLGAEEAFSTIQERLLFRYFRLFLHHHEKYIPPHLRERAMKDLAYLISVFPITLTRPYEATGKKTIKAFFLDPSEVDRHILMLKYRIEDLKREQSIFREIKSHYELVFRPSVQNWDWQALKNWSKLNVADPNSNPLLKAQKVLNESTKSLSHARYPRGTDDTSVVLALMSKDPLGEKLDRTYFSKIKRFQEPVLTSTEEASLFACAFPVVYRGQDTVASYEGKATKSTETKDKNPRGFVDVSTVFYKTTARKHLPPELEPKENKEIDDENSEEAKVISKPFLTPKGVVMAGDTLSFNSMNYPYEKLTFVAGDPVSLESMNFHRQLWPEVMEELIKRLANRRKAIDEKPEHDENYKACDEVDQLHIYDLSQLRDYDSLLKEYLDLLKIQRQLLDELHKGYDAYSLVPYPFQLFQYNGANLQTEKAPFPKSLVLNRKNIEDKHLLRRRLTIRGFKSVLSVYEKIDLSENRLVNPVPCEMLNMITSLNLSHNALESLRFVVPLLHHLVYLNLAYNSITDLSPLVDISDVEKRELETKLRTNVEKISEDQMNGLKTLDLWLHDAMKGLVEELKAKKQVAQEKFAIKKKGFEEELAGKRKGIAEATKLDLTQDLMALVQTMDNAAEQQEDFYGKLFQGLTREHEAAIKQLEEENESSIRTLTEDTKQAKLRLEEEFSQKIKKIEEAAAGEKEELMRKRQAQVNVTLRTLDLSHNRIKSVLAFEGDMPADIAEPSLALSQLPKAPPLYAQTKGIECLGRFQALLTLNLSGNTGISTLVGISSLTNLVDLGANGCGLYEDWRPLFPRSLKKLETLDVDGHLHLSFAPDQSGSAQTPEAIKANDEKFNQRFPALQTLKADRRTLKRDGSKAILLSDLSTAP